MKKLVRNQLKVVTGGLGCNPSAGVDCPRNTVCCALEWNSPSGVCKNLRTTVLAGHLTLKIKTTKLFLL